MTRYTILRPLTPDEKIIIVSSAINFFKPLSYEENCKILGKERDTTRIHPSSTHDFIQYLEKKSILPDAMKYQKHIRHLLSVLDRNGINNN